MLSKYMTINPEVKPTKAEKKLFKVSIDAQNKNIDKFRIYNQPKDLVAERKWSKV